MATVYITRYALTEGITEHDVPASDIRDGSVYPGKPFASYTSFELGKDAFLERADAVAAALALRDRKLRSLRKQIKAIEGLSFTI